MGTPRIHLVGAPSAGKTTLALELGERLDVPVHHLDPIAYADERWTPRPLPERLQALERIAAQPAWISEGSQPGWTETLLRAADLIVWLDLPLRVLLARTYTRHRLRGLAWTAARLRWQVAWHLRGYGPGTDLDRHPGRVAVRASLKPYAGKAVRLRANPSVDQVLALCAGRPADRSA